MSGIKLETPPPQMSGRTYNRIHKAAVGESLMIHRKKNLPIHFTKEAFIRYSQVYSKHRRAKIGMQGAIARKKNRVSVQEKFDAMHDRGNRAGILAFRKLLKGESITDAEQDAIIAGGVSRTSVTMRKARNARIARRQKEQQNQNFEPLVKSGLLKMMALNATASITGPSHLVAISIPGPFYLNINKGEFNKREALAVFNSDEEKDLAQNVDKKIQKELDQIFK